MITTIKGIYNEGKIMLSEDPPMQTKSDVIVMFLPDNIEQARISGQKIILGLLEGKIDTPGDFDEPLEDLKDYM